MVNEIGGTRSEGQVSVGAIHVMFGRKNIKGLDGFTEPIAGSVVEAIPATSPRS